MPEALQDKTSDSSSIEPPDEEILSTAREEFKAIDTRDRSARDEWDKCMAFAALQQWNQANIDGRGWNVPSLVVDHLNPIASQITNDWIRNRMAIEIAPADEIASEETAKIFSGYVRNVEYLSKAQTHVDDAFRQMVLGNRGYCGVMTERKPGTRKQQLVIRGFPDAQAVYLGDFKRPEQMDLDHAFVRDSATEAEFKRLFKKAELTDFGEWGSDLSDWYMKGMVSWAEYWKLRYRMRQIHFLKQAIKIKRDGRPLETDAVYDNELPSDMPDSFIEESEEEPERIVMQYLITGKEVLQRTRWLGKIIPIVPFTGRVVYVKGKKYIFSAISPSLDSQCQLNYAESSIAEQMGSTVHAPYVGAVGSFKTQVQSWMKAAIVRYPFLEYDPVIIQTANGAVIAPPPAKQNTEAQIQSYLEAAVHAADNIRLTSGINKSSLGIDDTSAKSGVAKKVDVAEGDNSSYDWHASGARSISVLGDILVDTAPKILGQNEIIQILDEQERQKSVLVNGEVKDNPRAPKGQDVSHYLDRGEYRVRVSAAPGHATMKKETKDELSEYYTESEPQQKAVILPWLIRSSNMNGKEELANQVSLPEYRKQPDGVPKVSPEAMAAIQEGHQLIQAADQHIAKLEEEKNAKILELQNKLDQIALKGDTDIAVARIAEEAKTGRTLFENQISAVQHTLDMITAHLQMGLNSQQSEADRQHEATLQQNTQQHAADMQGSDQAHQAGMQDQQLTAQQQQAREAAAAKGAV